MQEQLGYRDVGEGGKNLANVMRQSPTGSQLAIDGGFVLSVYTTNPSTVLFVPPDGTVVMWRDGAVLKLVGYTRATGWQVV